MTSPVQATTTALVIVDMQNDFVHRTGAYARAGQTAETISALPARLKQVADIGMCTLKPLVVLSSEALPRVFCQQSRLSCTETASDDKHRVRHA